MSRKGFTLIELLVVVAVLALLASIVFSNLGGAREGARISNALSFQSQTHSLLGSDLVGWWNFNQDNALDISGYGNHGTNNNGTYVNGVPGTGGRSLDFSGNGNVRTINNNGSLNLSDNFTVSTWVYSRSQNAMGMVHKGNSTVRGAGLAYGYNGNGFMFISWNGSNTPYDSQKTTDVNQWNFLVGVVENGTRHLYVNGEFIDSSSASVSSWDNENDLYIGSSGNPNSYFNGLIDDVRVYSRALTAQEIRTLYAQTKDKYLAENE